MTHGKVKTDFISNVSPELNKQSESAVNIVNLIHFTSQLTKKQL